ncbi:hypothetical protein C8J56DRAFT_1035363 [Mycena floridula]|nr:hypothetical protein C8J56DRAFT_1035363 [Mycena floridula]
MKHKFPPSFVLPPLGQSRVMAKWKLKLGFSKLTKPNPKLKTRWSRCRPMAMDIARTSLMALKESADAFPPLKSAVGSVLALWDIVEKMQSCKAHGQDLACRCVSILETLAALDPTNISPEMLKGIDGFKRLVTEIAQELSKHNRAMIFAQLAHLNRNLGRFETLSRKLDDASSLFVVATAGRIEASTTQINARLETSTMQINASNHEIQTAVNRTDLSTIEIKAQIGDVLASNTKVLEANTKLIYAQTFFFALSLAYGSTAIHMG